MRYGWSAVETSFRMRGMAKIAAILFLAMYVVVYLKEPFPGVWNDIVLYLLLVIAASLAAAVTTLIWLHYDQGDIPRRIWRYFAIGLWFWVAAEVTYGVLDVTQGEVVIGLQDVFWMTAYVFFTHALFIQYHLLVQPDKQELLKVVSFAIVGLLVLYALVYWMVAHAANVQNRLDIAVNSFYPVGDLFLGAVAVWLVSHFRGGAFARPWLGLLAFSFTDLLYAWLDTSGLYDKAPAWAALFDTTYLGAYLLLWLGLLSLWAFLKYGLRSPA